MRVKHNGFLFTLGFDSVLEIVFTLEIINYTFP